MQPLDVGMVIGFGQDARDHAALVGDPKATISAQRLQVYFLAHAAPLNAVDGERQACRAPKWHDGWQARTVPRLPANLSCIATIATASLGCAATKADFA